MMFIKPAFQSLQISPDASSQIRSLILLRALMESDWWQNSLWLKRAVTAMVVFQEESRNVTVTSLMGYFRITSEIYRIANNWICRASNVVVISHLKQFIGCSLAIIHGGHACFMNNQSNSNCNGLDNDELFRGIELFKLRDGVGQILSSSNILKLLWNFDEGVCLIATAPVPAHDRAFKCVHLPQKWCVLLLFFNYYYFTPDFRWWRK